MKIIGHTTTGYLIESSVSELHFLIGKSYSYRPEVPVGSVVNANESLAHIGKLKTNDEERKRIAESLRAAATLIENTPSPFSLPEPAPQAPQEVS